MSLKLNSSGGGSITLQEPSTASNRTLTLPDNTGTVVSTASTGVITQAMLASGVGATGPAFSAYQNATNNISNTTWTKISFQAETFDTANCFDSTTNYRFTPNVAGYYLIASSVQYNSTTSARMAIYKNGTNVASSGMVGLTSALSAQGCVSSVLYFNGTTDYVEIYMYQSTGGTVATVSGADVTNFTGVLVRGA